MARIKRKKRKDNLELNLTSMIDVIFQLLIFFMCATKFKSLEGKFSSYLPKDVGLESSVVINPNLDEVRIKLHFNESAQTTMLTRIEIILSNLKRYHLASWEELAQDMQAKRAEHKASNIKIPFIIDPDSKVPLQAVIYALNACRKARIEDVRFAAKSSVDIDHIAE